MVGARGKNTSLQGAEANSFLCFLVERVVPAHRERLTAEIWTPLMRAGEALLAMRNLLAQHKASFPADAVQDFNNAYHKYSRAREAAGLPFTLKAHQLAHLVPQLRRFGGPSAFANWADEQGNAALKAAARAAHRSVRHAMVLSELKKRQHYEKPSVQKKKKKAAAKKRLAKKMRKMRNM